MHRFLCSAGRPALWYTICLYWWKKGDLGGSRRAECDHGVVSGGQRPCHLSTERWLFFIHPWQQTQLENLLFRQLHYLHFLNIISCYLQAPNEVKYSAYVPSTSQSISPSWPAYSQSSKGLLKWKTQVQVNKKTFSQDIWTDADGNPVSSSLLHTQVRLGMLN